jgi:aspartate aminotransferase/aromatic-amino-acid transaminase
MHMFADIQAAPPDPIYNLTTACNADPNPQKLNLGVGVYKDAAGHIPVLDSVKTAEQRILTDEDTKNYLPIDGTPDFGEAVRSLVLGADHSLVAAPDSISLHTPGGTGALRLACELVAKNRPNATVWLSDPTWTNHAQIAQQAGLVVRTYPYLDAETHSILREKMFATWAAVPAGDVVLVHGCCHNPTGLDLEPDDWQRLAELSREQSFQVLVDLAYQGFGRGLDLDAAGVRVLADAGLPTLIASSYSKNFGLYNERTGALTACGFGPASGAMLSQLKVHARSLWSSPPAHGARIVSSILADRDLYAAWTVELAVMRDRINEMRSLLAESMHQHGADRDFSFITRQYGLFSLTGIDAEANARMREDQSIYFMSTGRINVAGLTAATIEHFCQAYVATLN